MLAALPLAFTDTHPRAHLSPTVCHHLAATVPFANLAGFLAASLGHGSHARPAETAEAAGRAGGGAAVVAATVAAVHSIASQPRR
jgi:hypothetical protein